MFRVIWSIAFGVATTIMLFVFFGFGWQSWTLFALLGLERLTRGGMRG